MLDLLGIKNAKIPHVIRWSKSAIKLNCKASQVGYAVISVQWHKLTVARSFDTSQKYAEKIN